MNKTDFECSLCLRIFYEPVSTPCDHVFCKGCITEALLHKEACPLCKKSLKNVINNCRINSELEQIILNKFPDEIKARKIEIKSLLIVDPYKVKNKLIIGNEHTMISPQELNQKYSPMEIVYQRRKWKKFKPIYC